MSLNKGEMWYSRIESPESVMRSFTMLRGPFEELYYVERNNDTQCDQIVRLTSNGSNKPTRTVVLKMIGEDLVAINLKL